MLFPSIGHLLSLLYLANTSSLFFLPSTLFRPVASSLVSLSFSLPLQILNATPILPSWSGMEGANEWKGGGEGGRAEEVEEGPQAKREGEQGLWHLSETVEEDFHRI
jgi:hypothetical protein